MCTPLLLLHQPTALALTAERTQHQRKAHAFSLGKEWCNVRGHALDQVYVMGNRNPPVGHLERGLTECHQLVKVWMGKDLSRQQGESCKSV